MLMLAQTEAQPLRLDRLRELWQRPELRADFEQLGWQRPEAIFSLYRLDAADLRKLAGGAVKNTDDHTLLEYRAPRALLAKNLSDENLKNVSGARTSPLPQDLVVEDARAVLLAALETHLNLDEISEAGDYATRLETEPATTEISLALARYDMLRGKVSEAKQKFEAVLKADRESLEAAWGLGEAARRLLQYDTSELLLLQVLGRDPNHLRAVESLARMERSRERWDQAAMWQAKRVSLEPDAPASEYAALGEFLVRAGRPDAAEKELLAALERDPCNYTAHRYLARVYIAREAWQKAQPHLEAAVRYYPSYDAQDYADLIDVYRKQNLRRDAAATLSKARRIFPNDPKLNGNHRIN
jgi:tetratricopeptide (TPR) repeat protein